MVALTLLVATSLGQIPPLPGGMYYLPPRPFLYVDAPQSARVKPTFTITVQVDGETRTYQTANRWAFVQNLRKEAARRNGELAYEGGVFVLTSGLPKDLFVAKKGKRP